jgi:hypothetical protein
MKEGREDKSWALHKFCCISVEELRRWSQRKKISLPFRIPMIWENLETIAIITIFAPVMCKQQK